MRWPARIEYRGPVTVFELVARPGGINAFISGLTVPAEALLRVAA
jgi:hypothetical protein